MHPLVRSVFLRARREDALVNDSELHPPDVQLAQPVKSPRSERCPVVRTDRFGKADLAKQASERGLGALGLHGRKSLAKQEAPAEVVGHREREAIAAVARLELALEVRRPDLVRTFGLEGRSTRMTPPMTTSPPPQESMAPENLVDRAPRGPVEPRVTLRQHPEQLLRSPAVLPTRFEDQLLGARGRAVRTAPRPSAELEQARFSFVVEAPCPFVAGRTTDSVPLAQLGHRPLAALPFMHKTRPLLRTSVKDEPGLYRPLDRS